MSDYQPADISALPGLWSAEHVIIRLYLPVEGEARVEHSRAQIRSGKRGFSSLGGYSWAYGSVEPRAAVEWALGLAASESLRVPVMWWDCEYEELGGQIRDYGPSPTQLWGLHNECARLGQRSGTYSGADWWKNRMLNLHSFRGLPFWWADYRRWNSILDVPHEGTGVDVLAGWQYTGGNGQDRSWMWDDVT